jgi:hypothetical protein
MLADETKTYEQMRRERTARELANCSPETSDRALRYSEYARALHALTEAATEYAKGEQAPLSGYEPGSFEEILEEAIGVISDLRFAVLADTREDADKLPLWSHRVQPIYDLRSKKAPAFDRPGIEAAVGRYLDLSYRSREIDRLLVDLLVALEFYAYGEQTINAFAIPGIVATSPLKRRVLVEWLVSNVLSVALWVALAFALWGLSRIQLFPSSWLVGANLVLGVLFVAGFAWSTVWLPRSWWVVHQEKLKIAALLDEMNCVYAELNSNGPISARHIEERARNAANAGVVWPAPLFALLDDINRRDGKF